MMTLDGDKLCPYETMNQFIYKISKGCQYILAALLRQYVMKNLRELKLHSFRIVLLNMIFYRESIEIIYFNNVGDVVGVLT